MPPVKSPNGMRQKRGLQRGAAIVSKNMARGDAVCFTPLG
jgi:hypothetical protein